jgi:hypothetical protein
MSRNRNTNEDMTPVETHLTADTYDAIYLMARAEGIPLSALIQRILEDATDTRALHSLPEEDPDTAEVPCVTR